MADWRKPPTVRAAAVKTLRWVGGVGVRTRDVLP